MLLLTVGQAAFALFLCIAMLDASPRGYDELKRFQSARLPAEEVGVVYQMAWKLFGPTNMTIFCAWLFGSVAMSIGAIALEPRLRRRWYLIGAAILGSAIVIMMVSLLILDHSGISYRWVRNDGEADPWKTLVVESSFYWQFPVVALIANPAAILLVFRWVTHSRVGTTARPGA